MILRELIAKFGLDFDEKSFKRADGAINELKNSVTSLIGVFIGLQGVKMGFDIARQSAEFADALTIFEAAGNSLDEFRTKTKGLLSDRALVTNYNLASQFGITKDQFLEFAVIADAAAKKLGRSQAYVFESLITGTARASKPILDNAGILLDAEKMIREGAAKLGKTSEQLTDFEKRAIIAKGVIAQGRLIVKSVQGVNATVSDVFDQWDSGWDNAKLAIGQVALAVVREFIPPLVKAFAAIVKGKKQITEFAISVIKNFKQLASPLVALLDLVGGTKTAIIALAIALGVYLVAQIGEVVIAFGVLNFAMLVTKAAMIADAVLIGAAFLIIGSAIALVGEEIESLFTDKQGLFETFAGRWDELAQNLFDKADQTKSFWGGALAYLGGVIASVINIIDQFFEAFFGQLTLLGRLWDDFFDLFDARTNLTAKNLYEKIAAAIDFVTTKVDYLLSLIDTISNLDTGRALASLFDKGSLPYNILTGNASGVTPSAAITAATNTSNGPTIVNSISAPIDASGQSLDESQVGDIVSRHIENALTTANATALQAMTPAPSSTP